MIVVFTSSGDAPAHTVVERLRERGANVVVLDTADLQRRWRVKAHFPGTIVIEHEAGAIDGAAIGAVLWRRPGRITADEPGRVDAYLAAEGRQHLAGVIGLLDAFWLPARLGHILATQHKLPQLRLARELGFEIPPTLVPTCADDVIAFWEEHAGRVVCKPLGPTAFDETFRDVTRYTEPMTRRQLAHADSVARCPVILQRHLDKRAELRVTVVGDRLFAAEIASQESHHTRTDWRKYDRHATPYRAVRLPDDLAARCVAITRALGLSYGAIDLVITDDDRHVFLEINPSGEFDFVEQRTGLPISAAIAALLIEHDKELPCVSPCELPSSI